MPYLKANRNLRVQPQIGQGAIEMAAFIAAPFYAKHMSHKAKKKAKEMLLLLWTRLDQLKQCQEAINHEMLRKDELIRRATVLKEKIEKGQVPKPLKPTAVGTGIRRVVGRKMVGMVLGKKPTTVAISSKGTVVAVKEEGKPTTAPIATSITGTTI